MAHSSIKKMRKIFLSSIFLSTICTTTQAQDVHFTQHYNAPLYYNPAHTGLVPDGDWRIGLNARNQWQTVKVPYNTFSGWGDAQILKDKFIFGWIGIGGTILSDKAGNGNLSTTRIAPSIAYHQQLGSLALLSLGFNASYVQKSIDITKLTFDTQWDDNTFNNTLNSGEGNITPSLSYLDLQVGVNLTLQPTENLSLLFSYSAAHITQPTETFLNQKNKIGLRQNSSVQATVQVNPYVQLQPSILYSTQKKASEIVGGLQYIQSLNQSDEQAIILGTYYRYQDAAIALVGYKHQGWKATLSYDATLSNLRQYNQYQGAYELSIIYTGLYPKSNGNSKKYFCPRL
jgi:type IX secretion system PorP/SprF family membrane protein